MAKITSRPQTADPTISKWQNENELLSLLMSVAVDPTMPPDYAIVQVRGGLLLLKTMGIIAAWDVIPTGGLHSLDFDVYIQLPEKKGAFVFTKLSTGANPLTLSTTGP